MSSVTHSAAQQRNNRHAPHAPSRCPRTTKKVLSSKFQVGTVCTCSNQHPHPPGSGQVPPETPSP